MKSIYSFLLLAAMLSVSTLSSGSKLSNAKATKDATSNAQPAPGVDIKAPIITATPDFKDAFKELRSLSRSERRDRVRAAKRELKAFKEEKKAGNSASTNTLLLVILAILLPPLAVYLHEDKINSKFWIDLLLTFLFILPGIIYALVVVLNKD